ncbi:hypothetical protein ACEUDB_11705 [Aeromonas hydrophila]|uniref:hypothetical protein n=1 Tax=Aeromonas hydrophila TaxID=644 RepID=UPI0038D13D1F
MEKCYIKRFTCLNYEIVFNDGVNYIVGANGTGKTTLLLIMQYSLGILSLPVYLTLEKTEIEIIVNNVAYKFTRMSDSKKINVASNNSNTTEFLVNSVEYNKFLIDLFHPKMELTDSSQIKTIIKDIFHSSNLKNEIPQSYLSYMMLGVNKIYEDDIKKKINILSEKVREKEKTVSTINKYKDDVLRNLSQENNSSIHELMNDIYEKYKEDQLSERNILVKSKHTFNTLKYENDATLQKTLNHLHSLYVKYNIENGENDDHFDIADILFKKYESHSAGERTYRENIAKILIQSGYSYTSGVGILLNDYNPQFLSSESKNKIRNLAEIAYKNEGLQYIELVHSTDNIDKNKVIYNLNDVYKKDKNKLFSILNRDVHNG